MDRLDVIAVFIGCSSLVIVTIILSEMAKYVEGAA